MEEDYQAVWRRGKKVHTCIPYRIWMIFQIRTMVGEVKPSNLKELEIVAEVELIIRMNYLFFPVRRVKLHS